MGYECNSVVDLGNCIKMADLGIGLQFLGEGRLEMGLTRYNLKEFYDFVRAAGNEKTESLLAGFDDKGTGWLEYDKGKLSLIDASGNRYEKVQDYLEPGFSIYRYLDQKGLTCVGGGETYSEESDLPKSEKSGWEKMKSILAAGLIVSMPMISLGGCASAGEDQPDPLKNLTERISSQTQEKNYHADKYAVLISGLTEEKHMKNLELADKVLLDKGYDENNTYILEGSGKKTGALPIDAPVTKESIEKVFDYLSKIIDKQDKLFVYMTGHGDQKIIGKNETSGFREYIKVSTLLFEGGYITEVDFQDYLKKIDLYRGIVVADQCHGGGFAERIGHGPYVGISASKANQHSEGNSFPQTFFTAGGNVSVDSNKDGSISIQEAFDYALRNDIQTLNGNQDPELVSDLDANKVFL